MAYSVFKTWKIPNLLEGKSCSLLFYISNPVITNKLKYWQSFGIFKENICALNTAHTWKALLHSKILINLQATYYCYNLTAPTELRTVHFDQISWFDYCSNHQRQKYFHLLWPQYPPVYKNVSDHRHGQTFHPVQKLAIVSLELHRNSKIIQTMIPV